MNKEIEGPQCPYKLEAPQEEKTMVSVTESLPQTHLIVQDEIRYYPGRVAKFKMGEIVPYPGGYAFVRFDHGHKACFVGPFATEKLARDAKDKYFEGMRQQYMRGKVKTSLIPNPYGGFNGGA